MPSGEHYVPPRERQELLAEVEEGDRAAEAAREKGDQKQLLERLEKGLYLRRRLYAEYSSEVAQACRRLCEACNCTATAMLQSGNLRGARELLKRAEQVSEKNDLDRAITWNNLAVYYRRTGKLRTAVTFLERALAIEEEERKADAAQTHLNLCATLSQLSRHADALYHAQRALIRIYEVLAPAMLAGSITGPGAPGEERHEQVTVLCIAYHNLAVEHEHLKNFEAALDNHAEGLKWASGLLGEGHQLINILRNSAEAVKGKLPANSNTVKRVSEMMDGLSVAPAANATAPRASVAASRGASQIDHMMTPRSTSEANGAAQESAIPTPQGSVGALDASPSKQSYKSSEADSADESYSDEGDQSQ